MDEDRIKNLTAVWANFLKLINERTGKFIKSYEERDGDKFDLPKLEIDVLRLGKIYHITIPGYLGGYSYFFEEKDNKLVMYADLTSRWQWHEEDYEYFKVTAEGYRKLQGKDRQETASKFSVLERGLLKEKYKKKPENI